MSFRIYHTVKEDLRNKVDRTDIAIMHTLDCMPEIVPDTVFLDNGIMEGYKLSTKMWCKKVFDYTKSGSSILVLPDVLGDSVGTIEVSSAAVKNLLLAREEAGLNKSIQCTLCYVYHGYSVIECINQLKELATLGNTKLLLGIPKSIRTEHGCLFIRVLAEQVYNELGIMTHWLGFNNFEELRHLDSNYVKSIDSTWVYKSLKRHSKYKVRLKDFESMAIWFDYHVRQCIYK